MFLITHSLPAGHRQGEQQIQSPRLAALPLAPCKGLRGSSAPEDVLADTTHSTIGQTEPNGAKRSDDFGQAMARVHDSPWTQRRISRGAL